MEKLFSLPDAKGNEDADAETAKDGCTNDKARPETTDVEPATTDGEAQAGSKRTRDAEEEEDPLTAFSRRTAETARRIKEKKKKAQTQSTLRFATAVDGAPKPSPVRRTDEAKARKSAAAHTNALLDQKEEFIQCETKATPALALKQAVRSGIVTLMEKLEGITILSLEGDADVIQNKGTLPMD